MDAAVATLVVFSRREEAVEFAQESADIYGNLVDQRRNEFLPDLAKSLTRVGKLLKETKRPEAALPPLRQAVEIRRRFLSGHPDPLPDLAESLAALTDCLRAIGKVEEAHNVACEATSVYRRLAADHPNDFLRPLAKSLWTVGEVLVGLGRVDEARATALESVKIVRTSAADRPNDNDLLRDLAVCLSYLTHWSRLSGSEKVLEYTRETVEAHRRAAAKFPAFISALAAWLSSLD